VDKKLDGSDDRALGAILVLACLEELARDVPSVTGPEPTLDLEDERALEDLGPDLVRRILKEDEGR
jgi:hypothetical protein